MPRKVKDVDITTRTARAKLKKRHKPYYRKIAGGLHLGYRKVTGGAGTWIARRYNGDGVYETDNLKNADGVFVIADDFDAADGVRVLNFEQAQKKASGARRSRSAPMSLLALATRRVPPASRKA